MRAVPRSTRAAAEAVMRRIDSARGYPRCERLSGGTTQIGGGRHVTCSCTDATSPREDCALATRTYAGVARHRDGRWLAGVPDDARGQLTAGQRAEVIDVDDAEVER